jgi:hypothetical protein
VNDGFKKFLEASEKNRADAFLGDMSGYATYRDPIACFHAPVLLMSQIWCCPPE